MVEQQNDLTELMHLLTQRLWSCSCWLNSRVMIVTDQSKASILSTSLPSTQSHTGRWHSANARQNRCQEDLNSFLFWELEQPTRTLSYYVDLKSDNLSLNEAIDVAQNHPLWRLMSTFDALVLGTQQLRLNKKNSSKIHLRIQLNSKLFKVIWRST